jgi:hypothetical protein
LLAQEDLSGKKKRLAGSKLPWMLLLLGVAGLGGEPAQAFTAYDCSNRSNIVKSYLMLEPETCTVSDANGEMKTVVYGKIVQMKQDQIILIF